METAFNALTPAEKELLLNGPALKPPPGVVPNFYLGSPLDKLCFGLVTLGIVLVTFSVLLRLYTKLSCVKKTRVEDCKLNLSNFHNGQYANAGWIP